MKDKEKNKKREKRRKSCSNVIDTRALSLGCG